MRKKRNTERDREENTWAPYILWKSLQLKGEKPGKIREDMLQWLSASVSTLAWAEAAIISQNQIPNICRKWKSLSHARLFIIPWNSPDQSTGWVLTAHSISYKLHESCFRNMCRTTFELEGEGWWVVTTEIRARIDWNEPQFTFQDFPWKLS